MRVSNPVCSILVVALCMVATLGVCAQGPAQNRAARGGRPGNFTFDTLLDRYDANKDGEVTRDEFQGPPNIFSRIDRNGDGTATREEYGADRGSRGTADTAPQPTEPESDVDSGQVPDSVTLRADLVYRDGNEKWQLDLAMPKAQAAEPRPALVFIHGGGWRSGDKGVGKWRSLPLDYAEKGYVAVSLNYRLTDEVPFPGCVEDVKCAVRWLRAHAKEYNLNPDRIGAYGMSAGAHLVAMLGLVGSDAGLEGVGPYPDQSSLVQAVCCSATPADFTDWGGGTFRGESTFLAGPTESLAERKVSASPITYVGPNAPPFLIVHGTADRTVPFSQAEKFVAALKEAGAKDVTFMPIEDAGHGVFNEHEEETHPAMEAFFARTLGPIPPADTESPEATEAAAPRPRDREPSWLMEPVEGPHLYYRTFESKAAGQAVSYLIYLPPDYETATDTRYPVVYWLHGIGGSQQGVPSMAARMTEAIAAGKTPPMIVVYVNGMVRSGYVDSADAKYPVETVTINELIPHIDATYRTIATREGRCIEGFSMGGGGAAKWGFKHIDLFGVVSILAGALHDAESIQRRGGAGFADTYGTVERFNAHNPWKLVEQNAGAIKGRTAIRIVVGDKDGLQEANTRYHELLGQLDIDHEFHVIANTPHSPNPLYDGLGEANWAFFRTAFSKSISTTSAER